MKKFSTVLSLLLIPLMVVVQLQAEMPGATAAVAESVPGSTTPKSQTAGETNALQIRLADAGNAVVEASSILKGYAVAVTDGAGLPVSDAAVAIRLPEDGPTGFFADGARSAVAYTNASGVATFAQVNWGSALGLVAIRVTAVKGEMHAGAIIEQTIVAHAAAATVPQAQVESQAQAKTQVKVAPGLTRAVLYQLRLIPRPRALPPQLPPSIAAPLRITKTRGRFSPPLRLSRWSPSSTPAALPATAAIRNGLCWRCWRRVPAWAPQWRWRAMAQRLQLLRPLV